MSAILKCRFLLASLQLKHVLFKSGREQMENALMTLPTELSAAYDDIIGRIKTNDIEMESVGFETLTWIFHAARPLQMEELCIALSVKQSHFEPDDEPQFHVADILEMCQSLVVHEEASGVVRFVHPTVQEFLRPLNLSHVNLAKTCLRYLEHKEFDLVCDSLDSFVLRLRRYKFCLYAGEFWGFHVRGEGENLPAIQQTIFRLLSSQDKRDSISQMALHSASKFDYYNFSTRNPPNLTVLHILATNGLAIMCRGLFET